MKNAEQFLHAPSINYLIGRWLTNITLQKRSLSQICLNIVRGNVVFGRLWSVWVTIGTIFRKLEKETIKR
jgi:hypothetical protein